MTIIFEEYFETKIRFVPLATKIHKNQGLIFNDNSRQFGVVNFCQFNDCSYSVFRILYAGEGVKCLVFRV